MESMSKIEAVLFDLDGTLLDSFPDFLASLENININSSSKKLMRVLLEQMFLMEAQNFLNLSLI